MVSDANKQPIVGIDFGTYACRAAVCTSSDTRDVVVPSLVAADPYGGLVAGDHANKLAGRDPAACVRSIKRLLGRRVGSPEVEWIAAGTPQLLAQTQRGLSVQLGGTLFSTQALAHALLQQVVEQAEAAIVPAPRKRRKLAAVLTVPAMFDLPQRLLLTRLATHAGLDVIRVIEDTAAALLGLDLPKDWKRLVVVDWGAGYYDISIVERRSSPEGEQFVVVGSEGDTLLGTDDLDQRIIHQLIQHFYRQHHIDLSTSSTAIARLRNQAQKIRQDARKRQPGATVLTNMVRRGDKGLPLVHPPLSARDLEAMCEEELAALVPPCLRLFEAQGLGTDDIDGLVMVGGASRLPFVRARLEGLLRLEALVPQDWQSACSRGAAILGRAMQEDSEPKVQSVMPHTLSVRAGQRMPVPITDRNQPLPISSSHFFKPEESQSGPIDLWLCQGEQEHGYDAFRVARARLEEAGDGSHVVEFNLTEAGELHFSVQPSAALSLEDPGARVSSVPPASEGSPQIVVNVDSLDSGALAAYMAALDESADDDEDFGGQPTVVARRVDGEEAASPSSRPESPLRRSMFGRAVPGMPVSKPAGASGVAASAVAPSTVSTSTVASAGEAAERAVVTEVVAAARPPKSTQIDQGPMSKRSTEDPLVGKVLGGRYEVSGILGEGAMARVYTARHSILGNKYAVKVMHPTLADDPNLRERFLREARAAAAIDSDHVVRILDFGKADDSRDYFVMEYLEGSSLEDEIQKHLVPMSTVMTAMIHMARGLEAAHEHNIVHRDLKPENVWITQVGSNMRVKILDFGVAKIPTAEAGLTMGNSIIGTPYYMAPEQVSGEVDRRTDIYATGIMMYELVTGRLPFHHESLAFVLAMQCDMPLPSPRELAGHMRCPEELDALIRKCAEKKKEDRVQSAKELRLALEKIKVS